MKAWKQRWKRWNRVKNPRLDDHVKSYSRCRNCCQLNMPHNAMTPAGFLTSSLILSVLLNFLVRTKTDPSDQTSNLLSFSSACVLTLSRRDEELCDVLVRIWYLAGMAARGNVSGTLWLGPLLFGGFFYIRYKNRRHSRTRGKVL